jgi:hypothetical protein
VPAFESVRGTGLVELAGSPSSACGVRSDGTLQCLSASDELFDGLTLSFVE